MQADISLISEIEQALQLAAYSGKLSNGYVKLSHNATPETSGEDVDAAMTAVFGEGWNTAGNESLILKYDSWGSNGVDEISPDDAEYVYLSSYMQGGRKDVLLSDVEKMTNMAQNLVTSLASSSGIDEGTTLSTLFGDEVLSDTAKKYGITLENGETWDTWGNKAENAIAYSNLLVLTAADEAEKYRAGQQTDDTSDDYTMSIASQMILEFSSYYGFAASNPQFSTQFDTYMAQLNDGTTVTDVSTGAIWYRNLKSAADANGYSTNYANGTAEQKAVDEAAFLAIMAGLGNPTEEQAASIASDLNNANLFTDGIVNSMYNDYLDAVDVMVAPALSGGDMLEFDLNDGEVLILLNTLRGEMSTSNSLPTT